MITLSPHDIRAYYKDRLPKLSQRDQEWRCPCPIHGGKRDSLAVNAETGQAYCHATCDRGWDVPAFEQALSGCDFRTAVRQISQIVGRDLSQGNGTQPRRRLVCEYDYCDADGKLLFQVCRYQPKDFRQRQPDGQGGWTWNLKGVRLVPFRLPQVSAASEIWITEGERDALALVKLGFTATCNPMGAGKWRAEYSTHFAGKTVLIVPDNDAPGRQHAQGVAQSLLGVAASVRIVSLPTAKDTSDWIAAGGTAEQLRELAAAASEYDPPAAHEDAVLSDKATPPSGDPDLTRQPFTDAGNAERLLAMHGDRLRYVTEWKGWTTYDGQRWARDTTQEVKRLAIDTARATYRQCVDIEDAEIRKALEKHARQSEQARGINNMLALAPALPGVTISAIDFDNQPLFLNCSNGTLDLQSGKLYPHRRSDQLMKLCPHVYDPSAQCPEFLRFLSQSMGDREGASAGQVEAAHVRVEFLRKATGMSLTADVSEKTVFCLFGPRDSGKTTFLNTIRCALGDDYAGQVLIDSLMANSRQSDNNAKADLVDLLGKRFVTTSEAEASQRLAEGRLKYLTQGAYSRIKAARKYENPIEFPATHKLWLDANERPEVWSTDDAVWERLKPVPFEFRIAVDEVDRGLARRLQSEAPGILAWAVQGCAQWLKDGLGEIPDVSKARDDWRSENNPLAEFIEDEAELKLGDREAFAWTTHIRTRYVKWADQNVGKKSQLSSKRFSERLKALGCRQGRRYDDSGRQHRTWEGVSLK